MKSIKHFTTKVDDQNKYRVYSVDKEDTGTFWLWVVEWVVVTPQDGRGSLLTWESYDDKEDAITAFEKHIKELEG